MELHRREQALARLVTVPTNGKGHSNITDLNLNSSDLAGSLLFSLQLNQSGLSVLTHGINQNLMKNDKIKGTFTLV